MSSDTARRRSKSWDYFELVDEKNFLAKCNTCQEIFSYRTTITNLMKHIRTAHKYLLQENYYNELNETQSEDEKVKVLDNNTKEEESVCLLCQKSFADQDQNEMTDHMTKVHNITRIKLLDGNIQLEQEISNMVNTRKTGTAWDYFTAKDPESDLAVCNFCESVCSYGANQADMVAHLIEHHRVTCLDGDTNDPGKRKRKRSSQAWDYFTVKDSNLKLATCNTCGAVYSYRSNVSNLLKHAERHHLVSRRDRDAEAKSTLYTPQRRWSNVEGMCKKRYLLRDQPARGREGSSNSNADPLFIKSGQKEEEDNEIEEMEEEYLDYYDDYEQEKEEKEEKFKSEIFQLSTRRPRPGSEKPRHCLDHFANYVTSLLQQLPDRVSKRLQMDFIRQIIEAQISCDNADQLSGRGGGARDEAVPSNGCQGNVCGNY